MIKKIIFVFKSHFDIGFTDLAENVIRNYSSGMLQQVIETARQSSSVRCEMPEPVCVFPETAP